MCDYDMYQMILYTIDMNCFTFIWHIMIIFMIYIFYICNMSYMYQDIYH